MPDHVVLKKSLDTLIEKADDVSDLARAQRVNADEQHQSARKLEDLSRDLKVDAADLKSEIAVNASRDKAQKKSAA